MTAPATAAQPSGPESGTDTGSAGVSSTNEPAGSGSGSDVVAEHDDGWMLLDSLRRRLDDQVAQTRRTQDQVSQLAESIGALVAIQRRRSRWLNLNSFVAYLIFTMLLGAGFLFVYHSRANELVESRQTAVSERDAAVRRADEAIAKASARDKAEQKVWDVYQLLEQGKRVDAAPQLAALRDLPLSRTERAVVGERAHQSQVAEVDAVLKAAVASFKAGRFADVIAPLEAALKGDPPAIRAAQMHYYLGVTYAKGDAKPAELEKAAVHLQAAVNADVDQEDARFQLASVLDRNGSYPRARVEYDKFATAHPQSQLAAFAMRRSATLARMPAAPPPPIVQPRPVVPGTGVPGVPGPVVPQPQQLQKPATPTAPPPTPLAAPTKAAAPAPAPTPATATPTQPLSAPPPAVDGPEGSLWTVPRHDEPRVSLVDDITRFDAPKPDPIKPEPTKPEPPKPTDPPKPSPDPKPTPEPKKPVTEPKPEPTKPAPEPTKPTPDPTKPSPKPFDPGKPTTPTKPRDGVSEGRPKPPVAPRDGTTDRPQQPTLPIVPRDGVADEPTPPSPTQPHPTTVAPVMP